MNSKNKVPTSNMYFCDNHGSKVLREQLITNLTSNYNCSGMELGDIFFSPENINKINKRIVEIAYKRTMNKIKIPLQNTDDIMVVCRYVWVQYAKHLPDNINEQVEELNCHVINEVMPDLISNIKQKIKYLDDISKPHDPIPPPLNVNKRGETLQSLSEKLHGGNKQDEIFKILY